MVWHKNTINAILILVLLGTHPVFLGHKYHIILPINEYATEEETFLKLTGKDISENDGMNSFFSTYLFSDYKKKILIITLYLPITFYFIRLLTKSSRTPRLPPVH